MKAVDLHKVFVDNQGVSYLRTENMSGGNTRFALNIGSSVEIIEMDTKTAKSRGLTWVECEVTEAANKLLFPLSKSVTISPKVESVLKSIAENKEILEMEKQKKAAKKPAAAPTKAAAKTSKTAAPKAKTAAAPKGERLRIALEAKIVAAYDKKNPPYRESSARMVLLEKAVAAGTVEKFYKAAGKPTGGTASAYLSLFVKAGCVKLVEPKA